MTDPTRPPALAQTAQQQTTAIDGAVTIRSLIAAIKAYPGGDAWVPPIVSDHLLSAAEAVAVKLMQTRVDHPRCPNCGYASPSPSVEQTIERNRGN